MTDGQVQEKRDIDSEKETWTLELGDSETEGQGQRNRDRERGTECATKPTLKMHTGEKQISTRIWLRQEGEMAMTQAL